MRGVLLAAVLTLLPAAPSTFQTQPDVGLFDSNGVPIRYSDRGRGETVLLLNGFGRTLEQWPPSVIFRLTGDGFRVVAYDARGHGGSGKPDAPEQYGQEDVNDAVRLLSHLSIDHAHVLGYSRGASIASRLVAQQPQRVRSVVFGGWGVGNPVDLLDPSECVATALAIEKGQPPTALVRALSPVGTPLPPSPPTSGEMPPLETRKALAAAFLGECRTRRVTTDELKTTRVPMLAIVGDLDGMAPSVKAMASRMPGLKIIAIPGANHMTAVGDRFLEEVVGFLREHRQSR